MIGFMDFISIYIIGTAETLLTFHFFTKFIGKPSKVFHYFLFAVISNFFIHVLPADMLVKLACYTILLLLYAITVFKTNAKLGVLYAIITVEIMQLCYGISKSFTGILSPMLYSLNPGNMGLSFMIASSLTAFSLSCLCYCVVLEYLACSEIEHNRYVLMTFIPLLMILMLSEYINYTVYSDTLVLSDNGELLHTDHLQMLVLQMFGLFSLFCIVRACKKLAVGFQLNVKLSGLEQQAHFQSQYVAEARSRYEKTRAFRHDMKNHLSVIHGLLEKGSTEEAVYYLQSIETLTNDFSFPCHTNNPVLDILTGNKLSLAQNSGITVSCSLEVPYPCPITDIDFCIILSNALDNAIHACKKTAENSRKWIEVSGRRQGDFFMIEIKNTCAEESVYQKGTGLSNIEAITEKYDGAMSIHEQGSVFSLSVLLIIPQQPKSISQQIYCNTTNRR